MSSSRRELLRASARIRERLLLPASGRVTVCLPDYHWQECVAASQLLEEISSRGWQTAARDVESRLRTGIVALQNALQQILHELQTPATPFVASQREIFEDLVALDAEFDDLDVDLKEKEVSVMTGPVTLEEVYLGPFLIILNWTNLGAPFSYRIVPIDSQYGAASRSETPHPHVDGQTLCEGEAKVPIRQALKQGRLFDFFTIVRQTLQTYNSASAYVQLSEWNGIRCADCDYVVQDDDRCSCERCGTSICEQCCGRCNGCEYYLCGHCVDTCPDCDQSYCKACLSRCRTCATQFCQECLTDGQCSNCRPANNEPETPESESNQLTTCAETSSPPAARDDPNRVRQVAVPARCWGD